MPASIRYGVQPLGCPRDSRNLSENQLEGELDLPAGQGRSEFACAGGVEGAIEAAEVRVVRQIEELGPELQPRAFRQREVFEYGEIHADEAGQCADVAAGV